jgi:hypothetical protein
MPYTYLDSIPKQVPPAYAPKSYGGLSNEVSIEPQAGRRVHAYIRPPTWVFLFINQLLYPVKMEDICFYFSENQKRHWTFGIERQGDRQRFPVMDYTPAELPYWATEDYQAELRKNYLTEQRI